VPRLYNKIYSKIKSSLDSKPGMLKKILSIAVESKLSTLRAGGGLDHTIYDKYLFKKIRELLGGKVRVMVTGSAPIAGDVLDFLKVCFSAPICEGYGMTEGCGGSVITFPNDPLTGIVGGPL
jgi:long-chain acyl-CoA synthetase